MRETDSSGAQVITVPASRTKAAEKLAGLSALAATREWERAALVALLVKKGRPGRKPVTSNGNSETTQYSIAEFVRIGIYGFRTHNAVDAYLKAWELSGRPLPAWGERVRLPTVEFPEASVLYGRSLEVDDEAEPLDGADSDADDTEEAEPAEETSGRPKPSTKPAGPRSKSVVTILGQLLKMMDATDPVLAVHGQPRDQVQLLLKTAESWVESLREAAEEIFSAED